MKTVLIVVSTLFTIAILGAIAFYFYMNNQNQSYATYNNFCSKNQVLNKIFFSFEDSPSSQPKLGTQAWLDETQANVDQAEKILKRAKTTDVPQVLERSHAQLIDYLEDYIDTSYKLINYHNLIVKVGKSPTAANLASLTNEAGSLYKSAVDLFHSSYTVLVYYESLPRDIRYKTPDCFTGAEWQKAKDELYKAIIEAHEGKQALEK